jgi:hypothetical protein
MAVLLGALAGHNPHGSVRVHVHHGHKPAVRHLVARGQQGEGRLAQPPLLEPNMTKRVLWAVVLGALHRSSIRLASFSPIPTTISGGKPCWTNFSRMGSGRAIRAFASSLGAARQNKPAASAASQSSQPATAAKLIGGRRSPSPGNRISFNTDGRIS